MRSNPQNLEENHMNCNRYRNDYNNRNRGATSNCAGSFTEYIPVTVYYDVVFGNGFVGGSGTVPAQSCMMPASENICYTPASDSCL